MIINLANEIKNYLINFSRIYSKFWQNYTHIFILSDK